MRVARARPAASASATLLVRLPELRGGPEVLDRADGPVAQRSSGLRELHELLAERGVADRVIFDLGLVRELGYYTGAVFEVYDPAVGFALGGGGRYDDLLGRFGRPLPACGVGAGRPARAHRAGGRGGAADEPRRSPCRAARCSTARSTCSTRSGSTPPRCASNDRKLLFADAGIVTMRPERRARPTSSTAPADIGITGKDVLLEQARARRLRAARPRLRPLPHGRGGARGRRPARRAAAPARPRSGSRPSTRASRPTTSRDTGRQAEIVEVKGSVELAPLDRPRRRHRRPDRHRPHAGRERPARARADRRRAPRV